MLLYEHELSIGRFGDSLMEMASLVSFKGIESLKSKIHFAPHFQNSNIAKYTLKMF